MAIPVGPDHSGLLHSASKQEIRLHPRKPFGLLHCVPTKGAGQPNALLPVCA